MTSVSEVEVAITLSVAYVGYALGKSDLRIHTRLTAVTVVVGVMLHGMWQLALPHEEIEWLALAIAGSGSPSLAAVALVETAGIWIPVLLIHWVALRTRIWATAYILGAGTVGAFAHYRSCRTPLGPHPEYELWLVLAFVFAMIPFAIGCIAKRRQQSSRV